MFLLIPSLIFQDHNQSLPEVVLERGILFNKVHGMHVFYYPQGDSRFSNPWEDCSRNCMFCARQSTILWTR
ncbi:hypothetical protein POPTR_013G143600v4 [Populus trichocarpa]|uniref:Uncharacterized protein n=1 Tax=Populus trichocarpa TaxID=3694 RepID=A0ACC0S394_POPTR|nr:hypothetical protein POPTR_013G143600v4 [Populus trichocarpa]